MRLQQTLANPVSCIGVGLHSGEPVTMTLRPAPPDTGVVFVNRNGHAGASLAASVDHLVPTELCTAISGNGFQVKTIEHVLAGKVKDFAVGPFDFDFTTSGGSAALTFHPCGLCRVVGSLGEKPGEAVLCHLFHVYWAGLVSAFLGGRYRCEVPSAGEVCRMELAPSA